MKIKDEIPPSQHNVTVSLLIGCNSLRALKPQEVILGNNDPYIVKTKLGWGIIGQASPSSLNNEDNAFFCQRIITCKVGKTRLDGTFVVDNQMKKSSTLLKSWECSKWTLLNSTVMIKSFLRKIRSSWKSLSTASTFKMVIVRCHYPWRTEICCYQTTTRQLKTVSGPSRNDLTPAKPIASTTWI